MSGIDILLTAHGVNEHKSSPGKQKKILWVTATRLSLLFQL
jgi:hypothetical protein